MRLSMLPVCAGPRVALLQLGVGTTALAPGCQKESPERLPDASARVR